MTKDVVIIGAGMAGLACAAALVDLRGPADGGGPVVLERSRGPGGRLATRELGGQAFDYGVQFLHSASPEFLHWAEQRLGDNRVVGWPVTIDGRPAPCQPGSLDPSQTRWALRGGLNALARLEADRLASQGVEFRWKTEVVGLVPHADGVTVLGGGGVLATARTVVLALAAPQSSALLASLGAHASGRALRGVLDAFASPPCLTVAALYPDHVASPAWHLAFADSPSLLLGSNQGSLHHPGGRALVVWQARPAWSFRHQDEPSQQWSRALLDEAGRVYGAWAARAEAVHAHLWKYSRLDGSGTAQRPLVAPVGGGRLVLAGELFSAEGGVEGAWKSGRLAAQLVRERA